MLQNGHIFELIHQQRRGVCVYGVVGGSEILMRKERKNKMKFTWGYKSKIRGALEQTAWATPPPTPWILSATVSQQTYVHTKPSRQNLFCKPQSYCNHPTWNNWETLTMRNANDELNFRDGIINHTGRDQAGGGGLLHDPLDLCRALTHLSPGAFPWREFIKLAQFGDICLGCRSGWRL